MSKLCIAIIKDVPDSHLLRSAINSLISKFDFAVFFSLAYEELFLQELVDDRTMICSFADSWISDNCEMLLLPDDSLINGQSNVLAFEERMCQIQCVLSLILDYVDKVELFVGDSGTMMEEFAHLSICLHQFIHRASLLNSMSPLDIHFVISKTEDGA